MARKPQSKELVNTRIANGYGGWIYCCNCNQTIGYLCYVTYDSFLLRYECTCGGSGSVYVTFGECSSVIKREEPLVQIKNRLCCPADRSPLFSIVENRLTHYRYEVVCLACGCRYEGEG